MELSPTLNLEGNISPYEDISVETALISDSPVGTGQEESNFHLEREDDDSEINLNEPEMFPFESAEEDIPNITKSERDSTVWGTISASTLVDQNEPSSDSEEIETKLTDNERLSSPILDPSNDSSTFDIPDIGYSTPKVIFSFSKSNGLIL